MLAILLALGASVCRGTGDFFGGLTTRRASLWAVVAGSQGVGPAGERPSLAQLAGAAVAATGVLLVASEPARRGEAVGAPALPGGPAVEPEVAAGASGPGGNATWSAGDRPGEAHRKAAGPSGTAAERRRTQRQAIGLSLLASACIGLTLLGYDAAAQHDPMWAMLAGRASSATFVGLFLVATRPRIIATAAAVPAS